MCSECTNILTGKRYTTRCDFCCGVAMLVGTAMVMVPRGYGGAVLCAHSLRNGGLAIRLNLTFKIVCTRFLVLRIDRKVCFDGVWSVWICVV